MPPVGKTALVTGAARGIGLAIATRLAADGVRVALLDQDADAVEVAARGIGRGALALAGDVTRAKDVDGAVARVEGAWGRLDVLVNNAGITGRSFPIWELSDEDWQRVIDVDLTSVFLCCRAAVKVMLRQGGGRIINIASIAGPLAAVTMPAYSVAKQGVITFTRVVAKELAAHGITVNAICPGVLYTEFWQKLAQHLADTNPAFKGMTARQVFEKRVTDIVPMKCEQTPEDIGNAAVFLASDEARYITGQALMVDGGCVMW